MPVAVYRPAVLLVVFRIHQPHVPAGQLVQGMVGEPQVLHAFDSRVSLRNRATCMVLRLNRSILERSVRMSFRVITACNGCRFGPKSRFCRYLTHSEKSLLS